PLGLRWVEVKSSAVAETSSTRAVLALTFERGIPAVLTVEESADGSFRTDIQPGETTVPFAYYRIQIRVGDTEGLYGLGAWLDDVNNRGRIRPMQMELDSTESSSDDNHVPVPVLIGTAGWGFFGELYHPGVFDAATKEQDLVDFVAATGPDSPKGFTFRLFAADHPLDILKRYFDATGFPLLPARWALGPWLWRDENKDQAEVEGDANTIRDLDLAHSGIWIDRPYATAVNTFDFNAPQFPDPQGMIDALHGLGYRVALWSTPYLEPETGDLLSYAEDHGFFPPVTGTLLNHWGEPIDFTNTEAYAWWQSLIGKYTSMGIEGFKLDYAEDVVPGLLGARNIWRFSDGSDERTMHRGYKLLYHKVYGDMLPASGGFLLCRAGTWGDQLNVSVIWPGDLDADFARHKEVKTDEDGKQYTAVGGLPASLVYNLSLSASGFPFYGADTGGYRHSPPDRETLIRWFEQTALSSVMQVGNSSSNVPWDLDRDPDTPPDDEFLGWYRTYVRLHLRLFPYEWTYAQNIAKDGRPIQRPLGLAYPELGVHPNDIYLFGDHLLAAPVVDRGVSERGVTFPPGRWADWWTGEVIEGGQTVTVQAPLQKLPLYLAEGGIVPLLRPTIDTTAPTTDPARVDSYATSPGVLYPRVFPGPASKFELFDGALLTQEKTSGAVTLGYKDGAEFKQGALFELVAAGARPASVIIDGGAAAELPDLAALEASGSGWTFDPADGGAVFVKVGAGEHAIEIR
ncbi:MAG: glycoside hydrolase family 31 protein, partial [Deltaproteobacteria bacterium]|nr:glycoside hydrolase family 31 protein [Deltaproteobacteria bacterium]